MSTSPTRTSPASPRLGAPPRWSAAKELGEDFAVYLTGVFLDPDTKPDGTTEIVVGAGFRWYPDDRMSLQVTLASGFNDVRGGGVQVSAGFAF